MTLEISLWSGFNDLRPRLGPGSRLNSMPALQDGAVPGQCGPWGRGKQAPEETLRGTLGKRIRPPSFPGPPIPI